MILDWQMVPQAQQALPVQLALPARRVLRVLVLKLKALLPRLVICLLLAISRVTPTLFKQTAIFILGLVRHGLMLGLSLVLQGRLARRVLRVLLAPPALLEILALLEQQVQLVRQAQLAQLLR